MYIIITKQSSKLMSNYSEKNNDKQRTNNNDTKEDKPAVVLQNHNKDGIYLLYPKTTINGSAFEDNSNESVSVKITTNDKDDYYMALVDNGDDDLETQPLDKEHVKPDKTHVVTEYKGDYITQFYVSSLTIVGLYILYKVIKKTR